MNQPQAVPEGTTPLPNSRKLPPVDREPKANIVYFFGWLERAAAKKQTAPKDPMAPLPDGSLAAACEICKKHYNVNVRASSIESYWQRLKENAKEVKVPWDLMAVGEIIGRQVDEKSVFDRVNKFLETFRSDEKFSGDTQRMMKMAYDASGGSNNNVRTRWWDMRMTAENISLRIEDPVLEQDEE